MAKWLDNAVFYEIYPQSFNDTNGDGIGDFNGITEKLDYISSLGCNAIWINPCFDSPFKDAGYDVRDYKKVAARYGTEDDLVNLFGEAHKRSMHILLDLVPGHTSEEHEWFLQSKKAETNEFSHRYIWTNGWLESADGLNFIAGESDRPGTYVLNFFKCQPALNYGFLHPEKPWQRSMDDPECLATREAIYDIICFWLEKGCDGFRVDMADSLIKKDDPGKPGTIRLWQDVLGRVHAKYPEAAFVSEWGRPNESIPAGFDMDFLLDWGGAGYNSLVRDYSNHWGEEGVDYSYFKKGSGGTPDKFLNEYLPLYEQAKGKGRIALITGNHDTTRLKFSLTDAEMAIYFAFIFTMPGTPFMYYGDEIGMRYQQLPTKEGGYTRTGTRTPMQWTAGVNAGFSDADADMLYLPVDPAADAPNVEAQEKDPDSLLNTFRKITAFRHSEADLLDSDNLKAISRDPFVYQRGAITLAVNPTGDDKIAWVPEGKQVLFTLGGADISGEKMILPAGSFIAIK